MYQVHKSAWSIALVALLGACGADKDGGTTGLDESRPTDSSGANGSVSLAFGPMTDLGLADAAPATIQVGDVTVTYAKFNIAKIKLKAARERSEPEKQLETQENAAEVVTAAEIAQAGGDTADAAPTLAGKDHDGGSGSGGPKHHKDAKDAKIARFQAKREDLGAKCRSELEREGKSDRATKFIGPYVYDAVAGTFAGDAPAVNVADGSYRRVEFQLKRDFASAASEPLFGNVFAIKGTVLLNGAAVPFVIDWSNALNFRMTGDSAFAVAPGTDNKLALGFDMTKWFAGIDWAGAAVDDDGTIYIDRDSNHDIVKALHRNIKLSAGFGKDQDGDGKIAHAEGAGKGEETSDAVAP